MVVRFILSFTLIFPLCSWSFGARSITIDEGISARLNQKWMSLAQDEKSAIRFLLEKIKRSPTGDKLIQKALLRAHAQGRTLVDTIQAGPVSVTDTTLTRRFSPGEPNHVVFETTSIISLDRNHSVYYAILDLAHELTHFTYRKGFNPYRDHFKLKGFVESTVEGTGGEVDAYLVECQVLSELYPLRFRSESNCLRLVDSNGKLSKEKGIQAFYQVGNFYDKFKRDLSKFQVVSRRHLPHLTNRKIHFVSSAWGLPYPVAAFKEYQTIMDKVCQNDFKRLALMKQKQRRSPASDMDQSFFLSFSQSFQKRCSLFTQNL